MSNDTAPLAATDAMAVHSSDESLNVLEAVDTESVVSPVVPMLVAKAESWQVKRHSHYAEIDQRLFRWMRAQHIFFVATAPGEMDLSRYDKMFTLCVKPITSISRHRS